MSGRRLETLRFFETGLHACNYLPQRWAGAIVADPRATLNPATYSVLAAHGFRRSGSHVYRPACPECAACVPVRIPVESFRPRRAQRRIASRNADLTYRSLPAAYHETHFALYRRYQQARHGDGEMAEHGPEDYRSFLLSSWCDTELIEMWAAGALVGVAVVDVLSDALSAVYTFFDPLAAARSPGVQAVLHCVHEARRRGLDWVYLGYWIDGCQKMSYKDEYRPQERFVNGRWIRVDRGFR